MKFIFFLLKFTLLHVYPIILVKRKSKWTLIKRYDILLIWLALINYFFLFFLQSWGSNSVPVHVLPLSFIPAYSFAHFPEDLGANISHSLQNSSILLHQSSCNKDFTLPLIYHPLAISQHLLNSAMDFHTSKVIYGDSAQQAGRAMTFSAQSIFRVLASVLLLPACVSLTESQWDLRLKDAASTTQTPVLGFWWLLGF